MVGVVASFGAGIWAAHSLDINLIFALILASLVLICAMANRSHAKNKEIIFILLWFAAGILRMDCAGQPESGSLLRYEGQNVTVHGTINGSSAVTAETGGNWRIRYPVELDRIKLTEGTEQSRTINTGVLLSVVQNSSLAAGVAGDEIAAVGKVRMIHSFHNPGQPDWSEILAGQGIMARVRANSGTLKITARNSGFARLTRWRAQICAELLASMPEGDAALIAGMLFGGYEGVERQTVREFGTTGIIHILSVSGAHIALVSVAVFWLTRRLSLPHGWSALFAAMAVLFYGFVSGFSPPVIRSVIMGLLAMAAIGCNRIPYAPHALFLAILGMLIWEPRNLFDISFQLSVGCTAGLLYMYDPIAKELKECLPDKIRSWILLSTAATLAAQLAVLPLLFWYFGAVPWISLLSNLLVVPLLEGVILMGLLGVILCGASPEAAHFLFSGVSLMTGAAVEINRFLARLPIGNLPVPAWNSSVVCFYYLFLGWWAGFFNRWLPSFDSILRQGLTTLISIMSLIVILLFFVARPDPLSVHFIDVGQGDATLIQTPHGRAILVDAGGSGGMGSAGFDVGERVVVPYLRHYGVHSLDLLILTHNHQDHAGGAAAVAELIGVHRVVAHPGDEESSAILRLQQAIKGESLRNPDGIDGLELDGVRLRLYKAGDEQELAMDAKSENARSTVVRVEYGQHSFLLTGDLEGKSEKKIITEGVLPSTVLKVGHHGSKRSCQPEFLSRVAPQFAVISVGADNPFGHPAPDTINRLTEWPVTLFRTDRNGAVVFRSDGQKLQFEKTLN